MQTWSSTVPVVPKTAKDLGEGLQSYWNISMTLFRCIAIDCCLDLPIRQSDFPIFVHLNPHSVAQRGLIPFLGTVSQEKAPLGEWGDQPPSPSLLR